MIRAKIGAQIRIARLRLRLRQADVASAAHVSRQTVSKIERGLFGRTNVEILDRIGSVLGIWFDIEVRSRGADLDRLVNARHIALADMVVAWINCQPEWSCEAEVSFASGRESGCIDILAYHAKTRMLVVIELKTGIYEIDSWLGALDRKARFARRVGAERGWAAAAVSVWLIVSDSSTNRRRLRAHRSLVASKLPADGRSLRPWFAHPERSIAGVAFWSNDSSGSVRRDIAARERVRKPANADANTDAPCRRDSVSGSATGRGKGQSAARAQTVRRDPRRGRNLDNAPDEID